MYFDALIKQLSAFFAEQGLADEGDGFFSGNGKTIRVFYNEEKKIYELYRKEEDGSLRLISSYLFDDSQTERDTEAVAIDFIDALRTDFGIKKVVSSDKVALPKGDEDSEKATQVDLTQKLLAIFPQFKDTYRNYVAENGSYLIADFSHTYFIPAIRDLLRSGSKKPIKKFYDAMGDLFIAADSATVPFVVGLIAAAVYDDAALLAAAKDFTADKSGFYTQILNLAKNMQHNKKLHECF